MAIKQSWLKDPTLVGTARVIYEAKKQDCWGNWQSEYRKSWPETDKDLRTALHLETDPGIEFAFVQAYAVLEFVRKPTEEILEEMLKAGEAVSRNPHKQTHRQWLTKVCIVMMGVFQVK